MLRFSANLSMLYAELPFVDRFAAAAKDGFTGVEYAVPYVEAPATLAERLKAHGLTQVLFNLPAGDWEKGERGIATLPDRVEEFRDSVATAIGYATVLGCTMVNCLAGIPTGIAPEAAGETLVENLRYAAPRFADVGVRLLIEPINPFDMPGFFLNSSADAMRILDRAEIDNLFIQYDFYHMQRVQGELLASFERLQPRIAHVQIADNPGRHEPGTGEINYPNVFSALQRLGYAGWIGAEYRPAAGTSGGLGWLRAAS